MTTIPVIDMSAFYNGDDNARAALARQVDETCRDVGFFTVAGHRVPPDLVTSLLQVAREFFALPLEEKLDVSHTAGHAAARLRAVQGAPPRAQPRGRDAARSARDLSHSAVRRSQPGHPVADPDAAPFYRPDIWPNRPADFRTDLYCATTRWSISSRVTSCACSPSRSTCAETYFDDKIDDHFAALNTFYLSRADRSTARRSASRRRAQRFRQPDDPARRKTHAGGLEVMGKDGAVALPAAAARAASSSISAT